MDATKVGLGGVLLLVSSVLLFAQGTIGSQIPVLLGSAAALGLAAGALLVGTSEGGRPV